MKILVACEESQEVCKAFRDKEHEAYSCDIIEPSGGHPEWHIKGDVLPLLNGNCKFQTMDGQVHEQNGIWDLIIAFPPCTYLTISGNRWFDVTRYGEKATQRYNDRYMAIVFFMHMVLANSTKVCVENPIGIMNTAYRKPDQIIQPYEFGHPTRKATCLWLKNLPKLVPTNIVEPELVSYQCKSGKIATFGKGIGQAIGEDGKKYGFSDPMTAKLRSKTFTGVAQAMAEQWGRR